MHAAMPAGLHRRLPAAYKALSHAQLLALADVAHPEPTPGRVRAGATTGGSARRVRSATVSAAQSDDHGSPLPECDGCRLGRRTRRGRESGDAALRPRETRPSPDLRSTRRSDWK